MAAATMAVSRFPARNAAASRPSPLYLFHPALDLMVMAGGLSLIVIPFAVLVSPVLGATVFAVLSLVCNFPHYMATNYRVYGSRAQINRYRFFAIYATSLILLVAVASHLLVGPWVYLPVVAYMFLGPYHYTGQNYGIALMYARRGGLDVTPGEKKLLYGSGVAFMVTYLLLITVRPLDMTLPVLTGLQVPPDLARRVHIALVAIGVAGASIVLWRMARRAPVRVLIPVIFLLAAQFLWFVVPSAMVLFNKQLVLTGLSVALFASATNFLHCAQYLGVTAYYTKRERAAASMPFRLGRYLLILVVGGAMLWSVGIRLFSEGFAVDYAISALVLGSLINLHHYALDGAIWKLRDGRIARLLVSPDVSAAADDPTPLVAPPVQPSRTGWRAVAWAAAACLALAAFSSDALRTYMLQQAAVLRGTDRWQDADAFYQSALSLNGRTADAMEGLAVAAMRAGNFEHAAEHWLESVRLNPLSGHLRAGLGETYLKLGRVDDAVVQLEQAVRLAPRDEVALRLLAQAHWSKGDRQRARDLMRQADAVRSEADRQRLAL